MRTKRSLSIRLGRLEQLEPRMLLSVSTPSQAVELFSLSPVLFVENQGQWADESIRYLHNGNGANIALTDEGIRFQVFRREAGSALWEANSALWEANSALWEANPFADPSVAGTERSDAPVSSLAPQSSILDPLSSSLDPLSSPLDPLSFSASFLGANSVQPTGRDEAITRFNYYLGDQSNWHSDVPSYESIAYKNLYDGIDLVTWGQRSHLKYEFHVAPGGDWRDIQIHYDNIAGLALSDDGSLVVNLSSSQAPPGNSLPRGSASTLSGDAPPSTELQAEPGGQSVPRQSLGTRDWPTITDAAPLVYQQINGQRIEIPSRFVLLDESTYAFELTGTFDAARELVIDPDLAWSAYLGGIRNDAGSGIAVDSAGNVLITGGTGSSGWVLGGFDTTFDGGESDAFVTKLNPSGAHLWSTYLGGSSWEGSSGIEVDTAGNVFVTGATNSADWVSGGFDTTRDREDGFVAKLSPSGAHLWSTYLGGSGNSDRGTGIAIDSAGDVLVIGRTNSPGWASGGFDTTYYAECCSVAFVAKLGWSGSHVWSTYLDGTSDGLGIAVDSGGNVLVTGTAGSSAGWISGGFDTTYNLGADAFAAKFNSSGAHVWSTFLGGGDHDWGNDIVVDAENDVLVTGSTSSRGWVSGGYDTYLNDREGDYGDDAFVVKLGADGAHLWSTYLGGSIYDKGFGIAVDSTGNAFVTGETYTSGTPTWVAGGFNTTQHYGYDAFVAKLGPLGDHIWSTHLGRGDKDRGYGIAVDSADNILVTGVTVTPGWVSGGFDTTHNGYDDGFVAKICDPTGDGLTGDLNHNCRIDLLDLAKLQRRFGQPGGVGNGDFNGSGVVDRPDLAAMVRVFGDWAASAPAPSPAALVVERAVEGPVGGESFRRIGGRESAKGFASHTVGIGASALRLTHPTRLSPPPSILNPQSSILSPPPSILNPRSSSLSPAARELSARDQVMAAWGDAAGSYWLARRRGRVLRISERI